MAVHLDLRGSRRFVDPPEECALQNRRLEMNCSFERDFSVTIQPPD